MDCDDNDPKRYMFAACTDIGGCSGYLDSNCECYLDGSTTSATWWLDEDGDGYGDPSTEMEACSAPIGYTNNGMDCDDTNPLLYSFAQCDIDGCTGYLDNNCECYLNSSQEKSTYWKDSDGDTYGDPNLSKEACTAPAGWTNNGMDCDDTNPKLYMFASCDFDGCTGYLNDKCECNSLQEKSTYWKDNDGDTYGDPNLSKEACTAPEGWTNNGMDCDDTNPQLYMFAPCDIDGCTGYLDDKCECYLDSSQEKFTYWKDSDGDTYGDPSLYKEACTDPAGWTNNGMDCDDTDANLYNFANCIDKDGCTGYLNDQCECNSSK